MKYPRLYPEYIATIMPDFQLTELQLTQLTVFLKAQQTTYEDRTLAARARDKKLKETKISVSLGKSLVDRLCVGCHGADGTGGRPNFNSLRGFVPPLDRTAERLWLDEDEASIVVEALIEGKVTSDNPAFSDLSRVGLMINRLDNMREIIVHGSTPGKDDPDLPSPPLPMPPWERMLSNSDVDSILAYLLTLQPPEDDEDEED